MLIYSHQNTDVNYIYANETLLFKFMRIGCGGFEDMKVVEDSDGCEDPEGFLNGLEGLNFL